MIRNVAATSSTTPPSSHSGPKSSGSALCKNYESAGDAVNSHANSAIASSVSASTPPEDTLAPAQGQHAPVTTTTTTTGAGAAAAAAAPSTGTPPAGNPIGKFPGNTPGKIPSKAFGKTASSPQGEFPETRNPFASTGTNNENSASSKKSNATVTWSDDTPSGPGDTLDFAKRDISKCSRASYSQLSTLSANSTEYILDSDSPEAEEPAIYQPDDHVRIRNPASAALTRMPECEAEKIGFHEPFGDTCSSGINSGSSSSSEDMRSPKTTNSSSDSNANSTSTANTYSFTASTAPAGGNASARTSPTTLEPYVPKRAKPYEPARVVLHKSELNAPYGAAGGSDNGANASEQQGRRSFSSVSLNSVPSRNNSVDRRGSELVPQSLVMQLAGSPDGRNSGPIKHIREPRHPIYVPAVLRPTLESSYADGNELESSGDVGSAGAAEAANAGGAGGAANSEGGSAVGGTGTAFNRLTRSAMASNRAVQKPATRHWMPDSARTACGDCNRNFTWYRRRHHCRKCGGLFCADDANRTIGLDRLLNFNVLGVPSKACKKCANEFATFCLDSPRLNDGPLTIQPPAIGPETEELEIGDERDWSTF